jgi:hypothetical protein
MMTRMARGECQAGVSSTRSSDRGSEKMNPKHLALIICAALVSASSIAPAQKNGSGCADRSKNAWCESRESTRRISNTLAAPQQTERVTAQCSAQGKHSLKISRARAAGASAKQQLASLFRGRPSSEQAARERRLIEAVYARSGSPNSIRAGIEAQCMAQNNPMRQALLLVALTGKLMSDTRADAAPLEE